jgi:hypothetical protein
MRSEAGRTAEDFAAQLGLRRRPELFLANGNGLRFSLGHELGHIRLHHVSLWYQIAVAHSQLIPLLGPLLSRLREYSCDRHGAWLSPLGARGLVVLASGRYTETEVDLDQLVQQGRRLRGFWVGLRRRTGADQLKRHQRRWAADPDRRDGSGHLPHSMEALEMRIET